MSHQATLVSADMLERLAFDSGAPIEHFAGRDWLHLPAGTFFSVPVAVK